MELVKPESIKLKKINTNKRKEATKLVYDVFNILDPSGANTKKYQKLFANMTNEQFCDFMNSMWRDDTINFILDIVDFEREVTIEKAEKAAKLLNIPLEEYVMLPHLNMNKENPVVTKIPIITMFMIFKRLQQTTRKKNSASIHISDRSAITGQVVGGDKNGRSSDVENAGLMTIGAVNTAREFNGFRADGMARKNYAYSKLTTEGSVSLEEIESVAGIGDRTMVNTIDALYLGMGIKTDLVDESLVLNKTAKEM